ncbi:mandelate racemase/muconate lactonizing enzyme family protein [Candidatus Poribacteria bacterium]|nr:mandelate racemase/muconate lactonizing enzyme family protein [Candidatus Poribacteria bacterium]MYF56754.1 mandelate racemase/muconate lactonizing enzyme family protein [Candidatus Poribacteria bacterium]
MEIESMPNYPTDIKITKIDHVTVEIDQPAIGCNSGAKEIKQPEPNGKWREGITRIYTNDGTLGWGPTSWGSAAEEAKTAINKNPFDLLNPENGVVEEYRGFENALWDTIGKILDKPAYQLMGTEVHGNGLPAYDSTIYFNDLLYETKTEGLKRIENDVKKSLADGFTACKMKMGRGNHLMERKAGLERDIEVVQLARSTAGNGFNILVDANNAYTYDEVITFLDETTNCDVFWIEEMFEEDVELYRNLKAYIQEKGLNTLIADGETRTRAPLEFYDPFFEAGVIDVIQHDMKGLGVTGWRRLADMAAKGNVKCAPHNWGSLLGFFLSLQFAKTIPHFLYGEVATLTSDVIDVSGYEFNGGTFTVPDTPGLGLEFNQDVYDAKYAGNEHWQVS